MTDSEPPWARLAPARRRFTVDDVRRGCRSLPPWGLNRLRNEIDPDLVRSAATLVPIVEFEGEAAVVVTKRPATMTYHRDDWVLPGGRVDPALDANGGEAARREAQEELGVARDRVELIGRLNSHGPIVTGFVIEVYVGVIETGTQIVPDPREVAEAKAIPLSELMRAGCYSESHTVPSHDTGPQVATARGPLTAAPLKFFAVRPGEALWGTQAEILYELLSHLVSVAAGADSTP